MSFAAGTKNCIHCGGRTYAAVETGEPIMKPGEFGFSGGEAQIGGGQPLEPEADTLESMFRRSTSSGSSSTSSTTLSPTQDDRRFSGEDAGDYSEAEGPPSPARSLLSTFGSLIWVAILILFSLGRTCGGE